VVNRASVRTNGSIAEITEEQWDRTIDVNLKRVFVVSRLAIPEMIKRGGGVILNIGARSGMAGQAGRAAYCASKGGMTTLTEAMAMDFAAQKIRVNCICPGPTRTPMVDTSTPERLVHYQRRVPIGRIGEPEDIAYAALYLASDEASMVTAAVLPVDGGMRLTGAEIYRADEPQLFPGAASQSVLSSSRVFARSVGKGAVQLRLLPRCSIVRVDA